MPRRVLLLRRVIFWLSERPRRTVGFHIHVSKGDSVLISNTKIILQGAFLREPLPAQAVSQGDLITGVHLRYAALCSLRLQQVVAPVHHGNAALWSLRRVARVRWRLRNTAPPPAVLPDTKHGQPFPHESSALFIIDYFRPPPRG